MKKKFFKAMLLVVLALSFFEFGKNVGKNSNKTKISYPSGSEKVSVKEIGQTTTGHTLILLENGHIVDYTDTISYQLNNSRK